MKIEYSNVKLPPGGIYGVSSTTSTLSANDGSTRLTRIVEDGRDDLIISRKGRPDVHLAWFLVRGGLVAAPAIAKAKPKKGSDE